MDKKEKAKRINLIDFCKIKGIPLIDEQSSHPKLQEHDSLVFFPESIEGQWFRFSTQEGGDSISFVQNYYNVDFKKAIDLLLDVNAREINPNDFRTKREPFRYEKKYESKSVAEARRYLIDERKIDKNIVDLFIDLGLIKQDSRNNVVFKWVEDGHLTGANRQGTQSRIKGERSWKKTDRNTTNGRGFNLKVGEPRIVRFFESAIDLMSYMSLYKSNLKDTWFISMEGLKNTLFSHYVSTAIEELNGKPPKVIYCIDNDRTGHEFADKLKGINSKHLYIEQPKEHKDWNDQLISEKCLDRKHLLNMRDEMIQY